MMQNNINAKSIYSCLDGAPVPGGLALGASGNLMTRYDVIAVHFGEIWLKGRNRSQFIAVLRRNIERALYGERYIELRVERDRFMIYLGDDSDQRSIMEKLGCVFGISWFALSVIAGQSIEEIAAGAGKLAEDAKWNGGVRVAASRSYKGYKYTSDGVVGELLKMQDRLPFHMDKDGPGRLFINIREGDAVLCSEKIRGLGGLPVGASGRAVVLLSGGIDSPVAAFLAMKRGLSPVYLHVHAFPDNGSAEKSKVGELVAHLSRHSGSSRIYYVPAHVFQAAATRAPQSHELVLFRYFLYRLAERVAKKENAIAIVTGESLGQVASQTAPNMLASQQGVKSLLVRPLVCMDKEEIIGIAKRIGTYDTSIRKYPDVCSMRARHPATSAKADDVIRLYRKCMLSKALSATLNRMAVVNVDL